MLSTETAHPFSCLDLLIFCQLDAWMLVETRLQFWDFAAFAEMMQILKKKPKKKS